MLAASLLNAFLPLWHVAPSPASKPSSLLSRAAASSGLQQHPVRWTACDSRRCRRFDARPTLIFQFRKRGACCTMHQWWHRCSVRACGFNSFGIPRIARRVGIAAQPRHKMHYASRCCFNLRYLSTALSAPFAACRPPHDSAK